MFCLHNNALKDRFRQDQSTLVIEIIVDKGESKEF